MRPPPMQFSHSADGKRRTGASDDADNEWNLSDACLLCIIKHTSTSFSLSDGNASVQTDDGA